jgi:hypothetical protein
VGRLAIPREKKRLFRYRAETATGPHATGRDGIDQPLISGSGVRNPDVSTAHHTILAVSTPHR